MSGLMTTYETKVVFMNRIATVRRRKIFSLCRTDDGGRREIKTENMIKEYTKDLAKLPPEPRRELAATAAEN